MGSLILNLRNSVWIEFLLGNSLDFRNTYLTVLLYGYLGRELSRISKKKKYGETLQSQLDSLGLQIKQGMIQDATFIHSDPGYEKSDKPRVN